MLEKTYTLIALAHFSGKTQIVKGDLIEGLSAKQVAGYLKKGSAKFQTKKEQSEFLEAFEKEERDEAERIAKAQAMLKQEELKNDLIASYTEVVGKEAAFLGVIYSEEEILQKVEELLLRVGKK